MSLYQRVLIPTDGSKLSRKASQAGIALAESLGADVVALNVVPRYPVSYFEGGVSLDSGDAARVEKQWSQKAEEMVAELKAQAEARGLKAKAVTVRSDLVAESIIAAAKKHKCDLIVMASHGRKGLKRLLLGSETTHVLTHSHIPVLVLR
jgi:nucleotide-binding universal stress UspA family protein